MRLLTFILLLLPALAQSAVTLDASCDASSNVLVTITASNDAMPSNWKGLMVVRTPVGECGAAETLNAEPLDLPAPGAAVVHEFASSAPVPGVNYRFETRAIDDDGHLHDLPGAVYDHVAVGPAPVFVGRVAHVAGGHYELQGCASDCWPACTDITAVQLGVTEVQMLVWATHHTTIAVYAAPAGPTAADTCYENVTEVKISEACAPAPTSEATWSSLKRSYR